MASSPLKVKMALRVFTTKKNPLRDQTLRDETQFVAQSDFARRKLNFVAQSLTRLHFVRRKTIRRTKSLCATTKHRREK